MNKLFAFAVLALCQMLSLSASAKDVETVSNIRETLKPLDSRDRYSGANSLGEVLMVVDRTFTDPEMLLKAIENSTKVCPDLKASIEKSGGMLVLTKESSLPVGGFVSLESKPVWAFVPEDLANRVKPEMLVTVRWPQGCAGVTLITGVFLQ
jgi:hypothetical protein